MLTHLSSSVRLIQAKASEDCFQCDTTSVFGVDVDVDLFKSTNAMGVCPFVRLSSSTSTTDSEHLQPSSSGFRIHAAGTKSGARPALSSRRPHSQTRRPTAFYNDGAESSWGYINWARQRALVSCIGEWDELARDPSALYSRGCWGRWTRLTVFLRFIKKDSSHPRSWFSRLESYLRYCSWKMFHRNGRMR